MWYSSYCGSSYFGAEILNFFQQCGTQLNIHIRNLLQIKLGKQLRPHKEFSNFNKGSASPSLHTVYSVLQSRNPA